MPELVVASFNLHAGIDGWGRPYDAVEACEQLGADVLVLQEAWTPAGGRGLAAEVADALGYDLREHQLADGLRLEAGPGAHTSWGPRGHDPLHPRRLWIGGEEATMQRRLLRWQGRAEVGSWGIAVLSRLEVRSSEVLELGRLRRDFTRRAALRVELDVAGRPLAVVGTHLAHFSHGSVFHLQELRRRLPAAASPAVLAGDMNFFGPPLAALLPGWRRAVRGRTWPSDRPHSQLDHVLVTRPVGVVSGEVCHLGRSDHRPVRARLALG